ncbi:MAG: 1-(5-phosphoribosyl)-5-[(5-phosphoribosylamino)methylideneamino]imidazole-4-carboxamide isomerase [Prevotellaceae bacterium]|jgi:phosphoribosylformimino-5-aminoimidazole carboxamide ribotide isomerase|nr:1-(5-phosphoribosyl)-5-[(5-phosphoribosylamino)methylideneamino]imidazole-4-carboxamide isomerase [Prevotellaceae bacterium]
MTPEIIPAIDIIDGKCVRLCKGDYAQQTVYADDPLEAAKRFEGAGFRRLHVVDLDGAKASHIVNHKTLERIATRCSLVVDFGGGLKTSDDLRIAFDCGAQMVTGGSIAVKNPDEFTRWLEQYGGSKIILGADVRNETIAVSGWQESANIALLPFIESYVGKGVTQVICTDIARDGMMQGPNVALYQKILAAFPSLHLIASGGVSSPRDVEALAAAGVPAAIVGKAMYEGKMGISTA